MQSSFEDVFPSDAGSVEEYLGAVHEMTLLAAMQEVERSSASAFESHMRHVMQEEWQRTSREMVQLLSRLPPATSPAPPLLRSAAAPRSPLLALPAPQPAAPEAKSREYGAVVQAMNSARERGQDYHTGTEMLRAFEKCEGGSTPPGVSVTCLHLWRLVQALLEGPVGGGWGVSRQFRMVQGARRHLEGGHALYMQQVIQTHPALVSTPCHRLCRHCCHGCRC